MFAKDISLRRMGFPTEGLDMWQMYDDNRDMHVLTAYIWAHRSSTPRMRGMGTGCRRVTIRVAVLDVLVIGICG